MRAFRRLFKDQQGATAVEYGLIIALIFLALIGGVSAFSATTIGMWNNVSEKVKGS